MELVRRFAMALGKAVPIILAGIGVLFVAFLIYLRIVFPPVLSQKEMAKDFAKNRENIELVVSYLIDFAEECEYISIDVDYETKEVDVYTSEQGHIAIDDEIVEKTAQALHKKGYSTFHRNGNTIHFQRSTRFRHFGSGIAYSFDGSEPNQSQIQFLTMIEPMAEPHWYYYEEDFDEFKRRYQEQQSEQQSGYDDIKVVWGSENRL